MPVRQTSKRKEMKMSKYKKFWIDSADVYYKEPYIVTEKPFRPDNYYEVIEVAALDRAVELLEECREFALRVFPERLDIEDKVDQFLKELES